MRSFKIFFPATFLILIFSLILIGILPGEFGRRYIYQTLWFKAIGFIAAVGIIAGIINFVKSRDFGLAIIYIGFFLILSGGFLTSLLEKEGFIEIKEGQCIDGFWIEDNLFHPLGFSMTLKDFSVEFYPDWEKEMRFIKGYKSSVKISSKNGDILKDGIIEVNRPLGFQGYNFYQYGYDARLPNQTILQVVKDPGLSVVYFGYLVLLTGMIFSFKRIWTNI